jgi:hypothetical protein
MVGKPLLVACYRTAVKSLLTGKADCNKIDILLLGRQFAFCYFPEDATCTNIQSRVVTAFFF